MATIKVHPRVDNFVCGFNMLSMQKKKKKNLTDFLSFLRVNDSIGFGREDLNLCAVCAEHCSLDASPVVNEEPQTYTLYAMHCTPHKNLCPDLLSCSYPGLRSPLALPPGQTRPTRTTLTCTVCSRAINHTQHACTSTQQKVLPLPFTPNSGYPHPTAPPFFNSPGTVPLPLQQAFLCPLQENSIKLS